MALCATASHVERLVRAWRRADRDAQPDAEQVLLASRALSMQVDEDGMVVLRGRLPPEVGAVLLRAVEAALEQVPASAEGGNGDESTIAQRRADALGLVAESALAGGLDPGNSADRFQVTVHVQADTLTAREAAREAAGEARRVSAETRTTGPVAPEQSTAAADAAPHVAAETWQHGAPDGNTMPGIASAVGRPLRDVRNRNSHGKVTIDASSFRDQSAWTRRDAKDHESRCAGPAARPPLRDKCARGGGGATHPSTSGPATVAAAHVSAETLQVHGAAGEWATPDLHLDAGLAVLEQVGGLHLGWEAARRVACDAGVVVLRHGADGEVLDVGRRTRTVPSALRRALQSRDHNQCQFPGCDSRRCDAHHVEHWADGGETRLQNLLSLCRFHHRAVHEAGFRVVPGDTGGQFQLLRPDGAPVPTEPPVSSWNGAPLAPTDARLAAAGISIGADTATPEWYGESLHLTAALDVLWEPPAAAARGSS